MKYMRLIALLTILLVSVIALNPVSADCGDAGEEACSFNAIIVSNQNITLSVDGDGNTLFQSANAPEVIIQTPEDAGLVEAYAINEEGIVIQFTNYRVDMTNFQAATGQAGTQNDTVVVRATQIGFDDYCGITMNSTTIGYTLHPLQYSGGDCSDYLTVSEDDALEANTLLDIEEAADQQDEPITIEGDEFTIVIENGEASLHAGSSVFPIPSQGGEGAVAGFIEGYVFGIQYNTVLATWNANGFIGGAEPTIVPNMVTRATQVDATTACIIGVQPDNNEHTALNVNVQVVPYAPLLDTPTALPACDEMQVTLADMNEAITLLEMPDDQTVTAHYNIVDCNEQEDCPIDGPTSVNRYRVALEDGSEVEIHFDSSQASWGVYEVGGDGVVETMAINHLVNGGMQDAGFGFRSYGSTNEEISIFNLAAFNQ